jgi:hypothetical protein
MIGGGKSREARSHHYHLPLFFGFEWKWKFAASLVVEMAMTGMEVVSVPVAD